MAESFASSSTQAGQTVRPPTVPPTPVAFRTLGCKVNQVESEDIATELIGRGARLTSEDEAAVVVVNTCTVTGEADRKARKLVRNLIRLPRTPIVVVTGCLASMDPVAIESLGERVVVEADKEMVAERVAELLAEVESPDQVSTAAPSQDAAGIGHGVFRTRVMLKVQDGCDSFCAYCIVPHARGVPRSEPMDAILARAEASVAAGAKEVVLTGVNLGRYEAPDRDAGAGLPALISAIATTGIGRLRLSSIEPMDITDELLGALRETGLSCPHLHVPLQSGSNQVLRNMGRGYDADQFLERLDAAREAIPGLAVTTDVIAGFPGETETDASQTVEFCRRAAFSKMHVFRYSARTGTPAAEMPDQVSPELRSERAQALRELARQMRSEYIRARAGSEAQVLVEETGVAEGVPYVRGTTGDYLRVRCAGCEAQVGDFAQVIVGAEDGAEVLADPL